MEAFAATFHLSAQQARHLQCTAEHLHARVDGGDNAQSNIVAACRYCNAGRHHRKVARDAAHHKEYVERLMRCRRWHASWVFEKRLYSGGAANTTSKVASYRI